MIADVRAYKDSLLTIKDDDDLNVPDSTKILLEKLKAMGVDSTEQKDEVVKEEIKEVVTDSQQPPKKKKWTDMNKLAKELGPIVVQKYCENPILIDGGRKFDIRAFMVVQCMKPYLVLYQPGYVRLSLNKYTSENFEKDKITHLTNNSVQKNHPEYKSLKEKSIFSMDQLTDDLIAQGKIESQEEYYEKVDKKIQEIMKLVFLTVKDKLDRKFGCFELFGFDFLVDD